MPIPVETRSGKTNADSRGSATLALQQDAFLQPKPSR
jgi:hypothetical protein